MKLLVITNTPAIVDNNVKTLFVSSQTAYMTSSNSITDIRMIHLLDYKFRLLSYIVFYIKIMYNLNKFECDRIIVHQVTHCLLPFFLFQNKLKITYLHYHGFDLIPQSFLVKFLKLILGGLITKCRGFIFPSRFFLEKFQTEYSVDRDNCFVSYSGGISNDFTCTDGARSIDMAFVGRIEEKKGVLQFLKLVKRAEIMNLNLKFHLHGYGKKFKAFCELCSEIKPETLKITLSDDPNDVKDIFQSAVCLGFPSKYKESLGLVVLEALRSGCYVLSTPQESLNNIVVDGKNGKFVDWEDVDSVLRILQDIKNVDHKCISDSVEEYLDFKVNKKLTEWICK